MLGGCVANRCASKIDLEEICIETGDPVIELAGAVDQNEDGRKYLANVKSEKVVRMTDADYNVIRDVTK